MYASLQVRSILQWKFTMILQWLELLAHNAHSAHSTCTNRHKIVPSGPLINNFCGCENAQSDAYNKSFRNCFRTVRSEKNFL